MMCAYLISTKSSSSFRSCGSFRSLQVEKSIIALHFRYSNRTVTKKSATYSSSLCSLLTLLTRFSRWTLQYSLFTNRKIYHTFLTVSPLLPGLPAGPAKPFWPYITSEYQIKKCKTYYAYKLTYALH